MKKFGIILIVLIIAIASCSKDEDTNPIVGTWVNSYELYDILFVDEVTFKSDNTGMVINKEAGIIIDQFPLTWSTKNNILTVSYDGETQTSTYAISGNKLTFGDEIYTRK